MSNLQSAPASVPEPRLRCIIVDDDPISRALLRRCIEQTVFLELLTELPSAVDAANYLSSRNDIDLIFLDVEMPEMSGLEMMGSNPNAPMVILCTANKEYALEAFEAGVVDFLLKPVKYSRFLKAAQKAREVTLLRQGDYPQAALAQADGLNEAAIAAINKEAAIYVKADANLYRIRLKDVQYVEALADYIKIQVGKELKVVHMTMKNIESRLPQPDFMRVHRSFIIRMDCITKISGETVLIGDKQIPIGGTYREALYKQLNIVS